VSDGPDTRDTVPGASLAGVSVLVTRARSQSAALAEPLEALGAEVVAFPVIDVAEPLDDGPLKAALASLASYDWLVLTSMNGVKRLFARLNAAGRSPEILLASVRVAAVGSATASGLRARGIEPDLVPTNFRAEGLVEAFAELGVGVGTRILIPRAAEAREVLPARLAESGAHVDAVDLYRLVPVDSDPEVLDRLARGDIDVITFGSGATARYFCEALERAGLEPAKVFADAKVASVGPVTTTGIRKLGFEVDIEAETSTMGSLVDAIVAACGSAG
jgi:uroporphyrinogen III methyltransferase/synthase